MYSVSVVFIPGKFWASPTVHFLQKVMITISILEVKTWLYLYISYFALQIYTNKFRLASLWFFEYSLAQQESKCLHSSRAKGITPELLFPVLCCAAGGCQKTPFENLSGLLPVLLQLYQEESQDGAKRFLLKTPVAHSAFGVLVL